MAVLDLTTELLTQIRDGLQESRGELLDTRVELLKRIERLDARLDHTRTDMLDTFVGARVELGEGIERLRQELAQLVGHVVTLADRVLRLEAGSVRS